jgi:hypothetical protein
VTRLRCGVRVRELGRVVTVLAALAGGHACGGADGDGGVRALSCEDGGVALAAAREPDTGHGIPQVVVASGSDEGGGEVVTGDWVATSPALAPDGRWLVVVRAEGDYESAGPAATALWRLDVDGGEARPLTEGPGDGGPDVSPDGNHVSFARELDGPGLRWQVARVPAEGGEPQDLTPVLDGLVVEATAWSPDGTQVAYITRPLDNGADRTRGLWVVPAGGGDPRHVADVADGRWLDWRGNGIALVGTLGAGDGTIAQVDVATGRVERLADYATMPAVSPDGERLYYAAREPAPPSPQVSGEPVQWRLSVARLTNDGLRHDRPVADVVHPFLYPYLGLSTGPCA